MTGSPERAARPSPVPRIRETTDPPRIAETPGVGGAADGPIRPRGDAQRPALPALGALPLVLVLALACSGPAPEPPAEAEPEAPAAGAGAEAAPPSVAAPSPDLVPFEQDGRFGYRSASGEARIPPRFAFAAEFGPGGLAWAADDAGPLWIDATGRERARALPYDNGADPFREGLTRVVRDGRVGFMDEAGTVVIEPRFGFALPFEGGAALVCTGCSEVAVGEHRKVEGGLWGAIDRGGRVLVPIEQADRSAAAAALASGAEQFP